MSNWSEEQMRSGEIGIELEDHIRESLLPHLPGWDSEDKRYREILDSIGRLADLIAKFEATSKLEQA